MLGSSQGVSSLSAKYVTIWPLPFTATCDQRAATHAYSWNVSWRDHCSAWPTLQPSSSGHRIHIKLKDHVCAFVCVCVCVCVRVCVCGMSHLAAALEGKGAIAGQLVCSVTDVDAVGQACALHAGRTVDGTANKRA